MKALLNLCLHLLLAIGVFHIKLNFYSKFYPNLNKKLSKGLRCSYLMKILHRASPTYVGYLIHSRKLGLFFIRDFIVNGSGKI